MEQHESTIWSDAVQKFKSIESEEDLRKNKLTASGYLDLHDVLRNIFGTDNRGITCIADVANWCKRNRLTVRGDGIGWEISL